MDPIVSAFHEDLILNTALLALIKPAVHAYLERQLAQGANAVASAVVQTWLLTAGDTSPIDPEEFEGHEMCHLLHCGYDVFQQSTVVSSLETLEAGLRNGTLDPSRVPDILFHKNVGLIASQWVRDAISFATGLEPHSAFACPGPAGEEIIQMESQLCVQILTMLGRSLKFCLHHPVGDAHYHALGAENAWTFYASPENCPLDTRRCRMAFVEY